MLENGGNPDILNTAAVRVDFRRSMYIVGLMLRFFDFNNKEVRGDKLNVSGIDGELRWWCGRRGGTIS